MADKTTNKKWDIDLSAWKTMRDVHEFHKAQRSGDLEKVFVACSDIIKSWEFAPDQSDPDAYFDLAPKQWTVARDAVNKTVSDFFQAEVEINPKDPNWEINLSGWKTMRDVHGFNKAQQSGDLEKVFEQFSSIIKAWEFAPDPSKSDEYFILAPEQWKVVRAHVNKAVTGFFQAADE